MILASFSGAAALAAEARERYRRASFKLVSGLPKAALAVLAMLLAPLATLLGASDGVAATDRKMAAHRGGTLLLTADSAFGSIDPQINYALGFAQIFAVTNDGLVAFRKADGPASNDVVPDLADAIPTPTDGGRTYVFHLRRGIRFSDGRNVTVADVAETFRRIFRVSSPVSGSFFSVIVGADACIRAPKGCMLAGGVEADPAANTITFHLTGPDSEFLQKLSLPFAMIVPADTPDHDIGDAAVPATGPYRIVSYDANRHMRLERNPYFNEWSHDAQPDGYVDAIDYSFGLRDEAAVTAVENNQYDWMYDYKPLDRLGELGARYTARVHVTPVPSTYYLPMNTNLYPFDHPKAREAVNVAVDRRAIMMFYGGPGAGTPLCQVLPVGFPAHVDYCPFTKGADIAHPATSWHAPDIARAKQLVEESGTKGAHVTLITTDRSVEVAMGAYLQSMLRRIGYDASVRSLDFNIEFTYIQNTNNKVQISLTDWNADYPAPSDFLRILYSCSTFHPGSDGSMNISGYCNHDLDAKMARAATLSLTDQAAGNAAWSEVDRDVTNLSLAANLIQEKWVDLVSTRLGGYAFSQIFHMIFSKVWVR